ncbi:hypothetical protein GALL_534620 [mine drainage metagenome]|uniref:Uncharacterized protein n=1 Tax=mine drainage metagenome TaxID=410659 RepID=A0A1J5PAZ4_9ZZZZ
MNPVFGVPTGTGVGPTGGMATQTPMPNTSGYVGLRWYSSINTKPRGFTSFSSPRTAATPRNGGRIMENPNGSVWVFSNAPESSICSTVISPAVTCFTLALVIQPMWRLRNSLSISDLVSPTPSRPRWPIYGSGVTKVIGTFWRIFFLRRAVSRMNTYS